MALVTSIDDETIEMVIYRHYGRQSAKLLNDVLMQDGNEHLPKYGIFLPTGTKVILPDIDDEPEVKKLERLQEIWD